MEIDHEAILRSFLNESAENLVTMEEALVNLEKKPDDQELLYTIFRIAHTLKGDSSLLGFDPLMDFAHILESLLASIENRTISLTNDLITVMLSTVDAFREMIPQAVAGNDYVKPKHKAIFTRLETLLLAQTNPINTITSSESSPITARKSLNGNYSSIRVSSEKLDRLLTLTGEIAIVHERLHQMLKAVQGQYGKQLLEAHQEADLLYSQLQELVMKARMVPLEPVFHQYIRTVRDLAADNQKQVELTVESKEVEADTNIIEQIKSPLTHMLRNAIDHAIEPPEVRKAKGKDPCGHITLRAFYEASLIVIQVIDDGQGIDQEQILAKAKEKGLVLDTEKLSNKEIYSLIFRPGFSTAKAITNLSGRGVGLDVVYKKIEALRGSVEVESYKDIGTTITLRLPLTLAIIEGFLVGVGQEAYVIPLDAVIECLALPQEEVKNFNQSQGIINLRDEVLPYLRLRKFFNLPDVETCQESLVVVQYGSSRVGIVVDNLYGTSQIVIKSLGKIFQQVVGISGSTILGTGRVGLILDVAAIFRQFITNK